jgi:catalase
VSKHPDSHGPNAQGPNSSGRYDIAALTKGRALVRLGGIAVVVAGVAVAFACAGGWLGPGGLTPARVIDVFQQNNGPHPGFRRNHAKGVCIAGNFASNGAGARLSRAAVFQPGATVPVIGRFAFAGGQPFMPDGARGVRSMALSFRPQGAEEWRTGINDIPVFPVSTPAAFYEQLVASAPDPATGKPDPAKMQAFLARHPETAKAMQLIMAGPHPTGFADASYNSLDAFRFIDAQGNSTPVRWSMAAAEGPTTPVPGGTPDKNYIFDDLIARVGQGPLHWHLVVTVGKPEDPTNNATLPWPQDREHLDVGTLTIDRVTAEAEGNCRDLNFDPLVLPDGIAASDDPLLSARSATYSNSFTRRAGEPKQPSAVQTDKGT